MIFDAFVVGNVRVCAVCTVYSVHTAVHQPSFGVLYKKYKFVCRIGCGNKFKVDENGK